jgi:hypothetical protein
MTNNTVLDEIDAPQLRPAEFWGQINLDAWECVLTKGVGKEPFNAQLHSPDKRAIALDFKLSPLADMNIQNTIDRSMIRDSREFASIVLPSIKTIGTSAKEINGRWVKMTFANTGRTYTDKHGETKDSTTIKFLAMFADENACRADYLSTHTAGTTLPASAPWEDTTPAAPVVNDKERTTAYQFLKVFVGNAVMGQTDLGVITKTLAGHIAMNPIVARHFTADSLESMNLIAEAMSK